MSCYGNLVAEMESLPTENRAVPFCTTCPTGAAQFCNLCVLGNAVVGDLTVQNSITLCNGMTMPCNCCYDGEISINADSMHAQDGSGSLAPTPFQPYLGLPGFPNTINGWRIEPSTVTSGPDTITAQFGIPKDFDASVVPVVTLHFFYQIVTGSASAVNFQVQADFVGNLAFVRNPQSFTGTTGDQTVIDEINIHQQVDIPLTGATITPGNFAQISVTRIATVEEVETRSPVFLMVVTFTYRKTQCTL